MPCLHRVPLCLSDSISSRVPAIKFFFRIGCFRVFSKAKYRPCEYPVHEYSDSPMFRYLQNKLLYKDQFGRGAPTLPPPFRTMSKISQFFFFDGFPKAVTSIQAALSWSQCCIIYGVLSPSVTLPTCAKHRCCIMMKVDALPVLKHESCE